MDQELQRSSTDSVPMKNAKQKARAALKRVYQRRLRENPTKAELYLWETLKDSQLGEKFTQQAIVAGFIPDFWCNRLRLVVEVDGSIHASRKDYDQWRDAIITRHRVLILRFSNEQVFENRAYCIERIKEAIKQRRNRPSVKRRDTIDQNANCRKSHRK